MNDVCQKATPENQVPKFWGNFRMAGFFNTIGSERPCGGAERAPEIVPIECPLSAFRSEWLATAENDRKRGVETKLIIGEEPAETDETLLRNIGRAHRYFDQVRSGKTFGEIAKAEGVSKRRIQQLIELAFLAPDAIRDVRDGRQPAGLKSDWLMRHAVPPIGPSSESYSPHSEPAIRPMISAVSNAR